MSSMQQIVPALMDERLSILCSLRRARIALGIRAKCHAYLYLRYWRINALLSFLMYACQAVALGYIVWRGGECSAGNATPSLAMQGLAFMFSGIAKQANYEKSYSGNKKDQESMDSTREEMELLETTNQHSRDSLEKIRERFSETIRIQLKGSEPIPTWVKQLIQGA